MTRIAKPAQYPKHYYDTVQQVAETGKVVKLENLTVVELRKLRGHFYSFKGSIKRAAEAAQNKEMRALPLSPDEKYFLQVYAWNERVGVWIDEVAMTLEFRNRDTGFYGQLMDKAKVVDGPAPFRTTEEKKFDSMGAAIFAAPGANATDIPSTSPATTAIKARVAVGDYPKQGEFEGMTPQLQELWLGVVPDLPAIMHKAIWGSLGGGK